jgi:hypothetical protein
MAAAYRLSRAGVKTLLVDRADQGRATDAGAGGLSPETNSRVVGATRETGWGFAPLATTAGGHEALGEGVLSLSPACGMSASSRGTAQQA